MRKFLRGGITRPLPGGLVVLPAAGWVLLVLAAASAGAEPPDGRAAAAEFIASRLRTTKGLALDVGCGDAGLAIELARRTGLKIRCVDPDPAAVERARKAIDAAGLYGTRVAADRGDIARLPYPSLSASLVICGDEFVDGRRGRDLAEIFRVLNPNGVAVIGQSAAAAERAGSRLTKEQLAGWLAEAKITSHEIIEQGGVWARIRRPRDPGWDEWTHRSHDPAGTYASSDTIAGPHLKLLWAAHPHPGLASAAILVANGRLIEIGRGYAARTDTTPYLQVSDAFTGIRLWSKVGRKELPIDRPLLNYSPIRSCSDAAVADDLLYLLGGKLCHVFDLATGRQRNPWPIPARARPAEDDIWLYLACVRGQVFGSSGKSPRHRLRGFTGWGGPHWRGVSSAVFALDRATGKPQWARSAPIETASIVIGDGHMLFIDVRKNIHSIDIKTGQEAFSAGSGIPPRGKITHCAYYRGKLWVMYSGDGDVSSKARDLGWKLAVFSAADGALLHQPRLREAVASMSFSQGTVFMAPQHHTGQIYALDADTAEVKRQLLRRAAHSKCTPVLATPNWLLYRHRAGSGFVRIDRKTGQRSVVHFVRCTCHYPGLPANGLLYVQGPGCCCAHPFRANVCLIPGRRALPEPAAPAGRLVKGPAFGRALAKADAPAWATWRADPTRAGKTDESAKHPLKLCWKQRPGGRLTPVAAAGGLLFVGSTSRKLQALDAATGKLRWQHLACGRIRVGPHYWRGRVYVGDDDGWVHCLAAEDGRVVWTFRAALGAERIVGYEDYMSAWPAGNGVLVREGVAYFTAGFFPGDGGRLYALDAVTGKVLWTKDRLYARRPIDCTFGPMAMGSTVLFMPTVGGAPIGVHVGDPNRRPYRNFRWQGAFSPRGHLVMTLADKVVVGSPWLQYIHHVTTYYDLVKALPVVTDEAIYLRDGRSLTAEKRAAYKVHLKRGEFTWVDSELPKRIRSSPDPSDVLWRAWKGVVMTCAIKAGGTIFTGSDGSAHATRAADGEELWSAAAGGEVVDLAFFGGRLFALTDAGDIACFGPAVSGSGEGSRPPPPEAGRP